MLPCVTRRAALDGPEYSHSQLKFHSHIVVLESQFSEINLACTRFPFIFMRDASPRQLERLFQLDELIRSGKAQTVRQLAAALEVSDRTVHNDLDFLRDRYEAPIENNRSRGYYYKDPTLMVGSRMLAASAGAAYAQELQSAIDQFSKN
jgi:biotin operon repressor